MPHDHHQSTGFGCLVGHWDEKRKLLPPCIKCGTCGEWIRPEHMSDECPGGHEEVGELRKKLLEAVQRFREASS